MFPINTVVLSAWTLNKVTYFYLFLKRFLSITLRIPTAHNFRIISVHK